MIFFCTFGTGSVLGKSYLVCHGPDEGSIRIALNKTTLPWFTLYSPSDFDNAIKRFDLVRLPRDFEVVGPHSYGPCPNKEM